MRHAPTNTRKRGGRRTTFQTSNGVTTWHSIEDTQGAIIHVDLGTIEEDIADDITKCLDAEFIKDELTRNIRGDRESHGHNSGD